MPKDNLKRIELLARKAAELDKPYPTQEETLERVERELDIYFPKELYVAYARYGHDALTPPFFIGLVDDGPDGVKANTLACRQTRGLPHRYVFLAEDDVATVFLETQDSRDKPTPVIYCDIMDAEALCNEEELQHNPTIFPSYTDFYEYFLNMQIEMIEEEKQSEE